VKRNETHAKRGIKSNLSKRLQDDWVSLYLKTKRNKTKQKGGKTPLPVVIYSGSDHMNGAVGAGSPHKMLSLYRELENSCWCLMSSSRARPQQNAGFVLPHAQLAYSSSKIFYHRIFLVM